jgi:MFS family permease
MRRLSVSNTVLLIICLMYLILYVDRVNISTAAPLIKAELNLSNTQLGFAFSAFAFPYALFQLIGDYFGDKFGPRLTLFVSGLIVCAATAATGAVGELASLVRGAAPSWNWRRRNFSNRDAGDAGVGAGAQLGFRPGHYAFICADRKCDNAASDCLLVGLVSWRGAFVGLAL